MRLLTKYLKNNRGATSVLIMIMMIILMIFGLAALTTAAASRKLAQKNAAWLKDYYTLHGEAEMAYAHLEDALNLSEEGINIDKIENALLRFLKENNDLSFQKLSESNTPFSIEMKIQEKGKEVPKKIQMIFLVEKKGESYQLKTQKWAQYQEDIFDPNDEPRFSDIKPE